MVSLAEELCAKATRSSVSSLWSRVQISVQGMLGGEHGWSGGEGAWREEPDHGDLEARLGRGGLILQLPVAQEGFIWASNMGRCVF